MRKITLCLFAVSLLSAGARAEELSYSLGVPSAPILNDTTSVASNGWLAVNKFYSACAVSAPVANNSGAAISEEQVASAPRYKLTGCEAGFSVERTKPDYYLADRITPPPNVDWVATYEEFLAHGDSYRLLFDTHGERIFATADGVARITWILKDGTSKVMSYIIAAATQGRPKRIYWTDYPYNAPGVDLSGKFVRFFGNEAILGLKYGVSTNFVGGYEQVVSNKVTEGLYLDPATMTLFAAGRLSGQVIMAYYDSGSYEVLNAVQVVEVREPTIIVCDGIIGEPLKPTGQGYDIDGLVPQPTYVSDTDNRGPYLYQHKGSYSYSPKNDYVYPLRPTVGSHWNAEVYWKEADVMGVLWPFEVCQYRCKWPENTQIFVRGDIDGDGGRPIYFPNGYNVELQKYQEPEDHARAPGTDGSFTTELSDSKPEGYSLLKITGNDNVWFLPIHSVRRSNPKYFTLEPADLSVASEARPRLGLSEGGFTTNFTSEVDLQSPGYLYPPTSGTHYNPNLYRAPKALVAGTDIGDANEENPMEEKLPSAVFPVNVPRDGVRNFEVWWNSTFQLEDMPDPVTVPCLPQSYTAVWPVEGSVPQIALASQKGSANDYLLNQIGSSLKAEGDNAWIGISERIFFGEGSGTVMFWTKAPSYDRGELVTFGENGSTPVLAISTAGRRIRVEAANEILSGEFVNADPSVWSHVALTWCPTNIMLVVDGTVVASKAVSGGRLNALSGTLYGNSLGAGGSRTVQANREFCEFSTWRRSYTAAELKSERYRHLTGAESGLTSYISVDSDADVTQIAGNIYVLEQVLFTESNAWEFSIRNGLGSPGYGNGVITADKTPRVYYENDSEAVGYNPNEEHAVIRAGSGGYVAWAIRSDLNLETTSKPAVLVEYEKDGRACMQYFAVVATNSVYPELAANCVAGLQLPGPHPLDFFPDPWLPETYWEQGNSATPAGFRDRKGQIWARCAGTLPIRMFYAMQEGFFFPTLDVQPPVGFPLPWLSLHGNPNGNPLTDNAALWTWHISWPENVPEMCIGQTLTVAKDGLPEVWGAKSIGLLYPDSQNDTTTVLLTDPTVSQSIDLPYDDLAVLGLKTGGGEKLTNRKGKFYFNGLPPAISHRVYLDPNLGEKGKLVVIGEKESNPGGVELLHFNILNSAERAALLAMADDPGPDPVVEEEEDEEEDGDEDDEDDEDDEPYFDSLAAATTPGTAYARWRNAVNGLGKAVVKPSVTKKGSRAAADDAEIHDRNKWVDETLRSIFGSEKHLASRAGSSTYEVMVDYKPVDHYAITAPGGTDYVTIIENDSEDTNVVNAGDPISMHVFRVVPKYYTGRVVTREDQVNLLSQQLDVIYEESFAGKADDYYFEWRYALPNSNGTIPNDYLNDYTKKFDDNLTLGLSRFTIGAQGDTLANMVNTYYVMRYKAKPDSPAYRTMGDTWSDWCAPPALAEGWVQRVLNNITPFTQRMTDLYENPAETSISMIQQAGPPYEGDVALNQDNLNSIGLIQLYQTILNKAESMSLLLDINDGAANKQLLLAVERLADLYTVLGDEAYSDALNPTIGFGSNFSEVGGGLGIDYGAASSSLFCFDNQVPSLLEEELALLRGRSGVNAPSTTLSPYYNRLVWNFTRGITAGEVAYAVNYNITGTKSGRIDYQEAAELYPQGHGDAYGHYLSALAGYYRLLRNPNFSWDVPAMGEMLVADAAVNVDYYDEAKFAQAADNVAKVAADVVDRTARKAWKDGDAKKAGGGYEDSNPNTAFGYGEWASRGGYGGLCNWAVANSLLPTRKQAADEMGVDLNDKGLMLIDRTTVGELADIAAQVKAIQAKVDTVDRGCNPLGLADGVVPFDITPLGASDGSYTHYEQIRERAGKAVANAQKVLDHAQVYANRLRMIEETAAAYEDNLDNMEDDFTSQLIAIFGYPYSDDIGVSGTYPEGYDGPDIYHYMWMDYTQYGLESLVNLNPITNITTNADGTFEDEKKLSFALSANGLVIKPDNITGTRRAQGEIQQAYSDFIMAYANVLQAEKNVNDQIDRLERMLKYSDGVANRAKARYDLAVRCGAIREALGAVNTFGNLMSLNLEEAEETVEDTTEAGSDSAPRTTGAGTTIITDIGAPISALVHAIGTAAKFAISSVKQTMESLVTLNEGILEELDNSEELILAGYEYQDAVAELQWDINDEADALGDLAVELNVAWGEMIAAQEVYNTVIAKGQGILDSRELARQQAVNNISKLKYNDMFFRKLHTEALNRYSTSFDLAQKYVFLAAKAYDYETGLLASDPESGNSFLGDIIGTRSLGNFAADGTPLTASSIGDGGLADILARMDANWDVLKPRLGINNPQPYATWFSLRRELFRILPGDEGDAAWRSELAKYKVDNLLALPEYRRYCQPLQCTGGIKEKEPAFVIPFSTTVDFARNFFGNELAGGDSTFDSTYFATKIAAAGVWFDRYNDGKDVLANTPNVYLIPVGADCMRAPGQDENSYLCYNVVDQTIPLPYDIGSSQLDSLEWMPLYDGYTGGVDLMTRIRRHPSFRAYSGSAPSNDNLDCARLVGRSVWNTKWLLIIPAGSLSADRDGGLATFLSGKDTNRDGVVDVPGVADIRIGFKSYANSGN